MTRIDLNADLGEGGSQDAALLALVSSANIACGGHAGGGEIMRRCIASALAAGVRIGAHPGYPDRENFGRREMRLPPAQVTALVLSQIREISALVGDKLHHVKPHGALYHQANREPALAEALIHAMLEASPALTLYAPPGGALEAAARAAKIPVKREGFADRRYTAEGSLVPRTEPGAVISCVAEAVAQASNLATSGNFDTLCIHGDTPQALAILQALRDAIGEFPAKAPAGSRALTRE
jgi:UPF0271 protein